MPSSFCFPCLGACQGFALTTWFCSLRPLQGSVVVSFSVTVLTSEATTATGAPT